MPAVRAAVEVLLGPADEALRGLEDDFALLAAGAAAARTWSCRQPTVVLGASRDAEAEVDLAECRSRGVGVVRRASGGGTVLVEQGTLQYALVLPHPCDGPAPSLDEARRASNALAREALRAAGGPATLQEDASGDLRLGDRKVGGLAMRRNRHATLVHGTLLLEADLGRIAAVLRHPRREPAWRRGRSHAEFLATLGRIDAEAFARTLAALGSQAR